MSTYHSIHFHIVFATKHRHPWIKKDWIHQLHAYLGGTSKGLGAVPEKIGGVSDHVHLLLGCATTHQPSNLVREIKKSSSAWVHGTIGFEPFRWQDGYSIFSVSPNARRAVAAYIEHQAEHHRHRSFREEFVAMLNEAAIEYDPKYLE